MILDKLNRIAEELPQNKAPIHELRLSSSGDCPRLLVYEGLEGKRPILAQQFFRMEAGHAIHKMMQEFIQMALGEDFFDIEREVEILLPEFKILGHPDGRLKSLKATLEIKSVSDATFTMIQNQGKPLPAHIDQANSYASVLEDPWVLILYFNRDTGETIEFMFETSPELYQAVLTKFSQVRSYIAKKELPVRPYHDATESPCWFCSFKEKCYEGFSAEVGGFIEADFAEPEFMTVLRDAIYQRKTRLLAEKTEEARKKYLGLFLMDKGVKFARTSDGTVAIAIGKNNNLLVNIKPKKETT